MGGGRRTFGQRIWLAIATGRNAAGSFVDSVVGVFNPEAGLQRRALRAIASASERRISQYYDDDRGSDPQHGPQRWMASRLSPDSELERDILEIRKRSLELYRDSTIGGAIETKLDHIVGQGFTYRPRISEQPGITATQAKGWNQQILECHNRWASRCDISGTCSLWECNRLSHRSWEYAGESLTIMYNDKRPYSPIPLILEVVDVERLSTPPERMGDKYCRLGIQYNDSGSGEILGYWIRTTQPYDTKQVEFKWEFHAAENVIHLFERWFPQQSRGYPWLQRTLDRIRDSEDLDEAGIIAAQVEACNAAFVKTREPLKTAQAAARGMARGKRLEDIIPGKIQYLDADAEEVIFNTPTKTNIVGTLHEWNYRRIAAGSDWPYEFLMKDWRGISFAGGRLVLCGAKIKCGVAQKFNVVKWLTPIAERATTQMILFGVVEGINLAKFQQRPWIFTAHSWTPQRWSYALNPGEEISSTVMAVENNMMTKAQAAEENGDLLDEIYDERQREVEQEEQRGITSAGRLLAVGQSGGLAEEDEPDPAAGKAASKTGSKKKSADS